MVKIYGDTKKLSLIRKNRRSNKEIHCSDYDVGVDLNRNYDFKFGYDNIGSNLSACAEDYRGPSAFSESETIAVRDIVLKYQDNIKLMINFHAYGNLWVIPYNYIKDASSLKDNMTVFNIYEDFKNSGLLTQHAVYGNAFKTVEYVANGEASDWALGKLGIISFSPELGDEHKESGAFFPPVSEITDILVTAYSEIEWIMKSVNINFGFDYGEVYSQQNQLLLKEAFDYGKRAKAVYTFQLFNHALTSAKDLSFYFNLTIPDVRANSIPIDAIITWTQYTIDDYNQMSSFKGGALERRGVYNLTDFVNQYVYTASNIVKNVIRPNETSVNYTFTELVEFKRRHYLKVNVFLLSDFKIESNDTCYMDLKLTNPHGDQFSISASMQLVWRDDLPASASEILIWLILGVLIMVAIYCIIPKIITPLSITIKQKIINRNAHFSELNEFTDPPDVENMHENAGESVALDKSVELGAGSSNRLDR
jgi:hypothetical protein